MAYWGSGGPEGQGNVPSNASACNAAQARSRLQSHKLVYRGPGTQTIQKQGALLSSSGNSRSWSGCRAQHSPQAMWELPVCTAGHC